MNIINRYAINNDSTDWGAAEGQITNLGHSGSATVVSIKSSTAGKKRKAEDGNNGRDKDKKTHQEREKGEAVKTARK